MDHKRTILIVDDEPIMHKILAGLLGDEEYQFVSAANGLEAVENIAHLNPDLILCDVMMPGMNGFEVCHRLKTSKAWQHLPIILITALDSKEDLATGLNAGANDFLTKPFDRTELIARVRSMLRIKAQYDELEGQKQELQASLHLKEEFARVTARHLEELERLHRVGLRLMSNLDTDSVISMTSQVALEIVPPANRCVMHLSSDDGQQLLPVVFAGDGSKIVYPTIGIERLVKHALDARKTVYVPDVRLDSRHSGLQFDDMRALMVVPLLDNRQVIGALSLCSAEVNAFAESHRHLLSILANQASVAIVRTRFFEGKARAQEQEKRAIRNLFGRYVSPTVVDRLVDGMENLGLGGKRQEITVLFADLRGFTSFSENMPPEDLVEVLNQYFAQAVDAILGQEGTLDKFIGDAVMAIFNAPLPQPDHTLRAVRAALAMQQIVADYHATAANDRCLEFGIGIHVGPAVVGNIGTVQQMNYTAIGDTVNLAKRLQENAQGGQIILSQAAYNAVKDAVVVEDLGPLMVKGRATPVHTYRLVDLNVIVAQPDMTKTECGV
ncbi:MAG: response regulator [Anaerolineae bacterium]|nr:response regulator [Anaerolineae bacterium]